MSAIRGVRGGIRSLVRAHATRPNQPIEGKPPRRLIFVGPPGVGKGTYSRIVSKELGIPTIATGSLIRDQVRSRSPIGLKVDEIVKSGSLISDDIVLELLDHRLKDHDQGKGFILDGVPRTVGQARDLPGVTDIDAVLVMGLDELALREKLSGRRVCSGCGRNYNVAHIKYDGMDLPPLLPSTENGNCDDCGSTLEHRDDDLPHVVEHRLEVYHAETEPVIDFYRNCPSGTPVLDFQVTGTIEPMMPKLRALLQMPDPDVHS